MVCDGFCTCIGSRCNGRGVCLTSGHDPQCLNQQHMMHNHAKHCYTYPHGQSLSYLQGAEYAGYTNATRKLKLVYSTVLAAMYHSDLLTSRTKSSYCHLYLPSSILLKSLLRPIFSPYKEERSIDIPFNKNQKSLALTDQSFRSSL